MRPDRGLYDLDEMIASGQVEGDVVAAQRRVEITARDRAFEYALSNDDELMIEIAKASSKAVEQEQRKVARASDLGQAGQDPVVNDAVDE